jgi:2,4-diketo-3-deoxy-L-fuconate hydrolase
MKLLRYGNPGFELPGALDSDGNIRDLSGLVSDIDGDSLASITVQDIDLSGLPIVADVSRLGPCVGKVGKFICIGLNYVDHARESGMTLPDEPEVFTKATSSISGPNDDISSP